MHIIQIECDDQATDVCAFRNSGIAGDCGQGIVSWST